MWLTRLAAVAFSYYETLLRVGDKQKFLEEETRLKSLANLLNEVGYQEHIYEDWAEDTFDLLRETASAVDANDDGAALLRAFNDDNRSRSIITYLKVSPPVSGVSASDYLRFCLDLNQCLDSDAPK
jgi:ubiquitin thioesterase protein OTUB1